MKKNLFVKLVFLFIASLTLYGYEYSSSGNFKAGHTAWLVGDQNINTYWQLEENQTDGFLNILSETEKKTKVIIDIELAKDSSIQLFSDGGSGLKAISGCVKEGPFEGELVFDIPENLRAGNQILVRVKGSKAYETKVSEIYFETSDEENEFGKIKPFAYSINIEENINLKAERLWDGSVEGAWFEPNWSIPWDVEGNPNINRKKEIFGNYTGYPSKAAEIIWELDGLYDISAVKTYIINAFRCVKFEYNSNGIWKNIAELGPYNQQNNSWQRCDVYGITTDRIRITFPNGWEQARFLSEIEIWGTRKNTIEVKGSGEYFLNGSFDSENNKYWYILDSAKKDLEVEVTYNGLRNEIPLLQVNNHSIKKAAKKILNGNEVVVYTISKEVLRSDKQFISIEDNAVAGVLVRNVNDKGIVKESDNADIEKVILNDGNGNVIEIEGNGKKLSKIDLSRYKGWNKILYGSLVSDKEISVELYRPLDKDNTWDGCIIGMTGDSQVSVFASGYGLSRADRVFWIPLNMVDFYKLKGKLSVTAEKNGIKTQYDYLVKAGINQKSGKINGTEDLEYTDNSKWEISGRVYDRETIVYVNGVKINKASNGTFSENVSISEGYQTITVEAVLYGNTVGFWTKEIYRFSEEGINISLNGDENGILTKEDNYTIHGCISNAINPQLYINGNKVQIENGSFESTIQLVEGENIVNIHAEDENGRNKEIVLVIIKDSTAPVVQIVYPQDNSYISSSQITLQVQADSENYWYSINGEVPEFCETNLYEKVLDYADGFYELILDVNDNAGNKAEEIKINFCIDVTSPEEFSIIPDRETSVEDWRNTNTITVTFDTTDETSGIERFEYTWGKDEWKECISPAQFDNIEDGKHTLFIRAVDKAGNTRLSTLDVYVDVTAPINLDLYADIEKENWTNVTEFALYCNAQDETSGIKKFGLCIDDNEEQVWTSGNIVSGLEDGIHNFKLYAYDKANNRALVAADYYLDTTAPDAFDGVFDVEGWTNNCEPSVTFETTDNCSGILKYEILLDDEEWIETSSPYKYPPLKNGIHTTKIRAYDKAGNYTDTVSYDLMIDMEPPKPVMNCKLVPGNTQMEGFWETDDEDIRQYRIVWIQNDVREEFYTNKTSYKRTGITNGTVIEMSVYPIDRAQNSVNEDEVKSVMALTGSAIVQLKQDEATLVEFNNIKMAVPAQGKESKIKGIMVKEIESKTISDKSVNPIISPIYSFTTLNDEQNNGILIESTHAYFNEEVIVFLSYDDNLVPTGYPENNLEVYYYDDLWGRWFRTEKSAIDTEQNIIVFATNHFTNFAVQPTLMRDLSPEELKKAGHAYGNAESTTGEITISTDSGTMLTEATEFVIHGKNGFEFPVKRIYDTQTARMDGPSILTQMSLGINFNAYMGESIIKQLKGAGLSLVTSTLKSMFSNYFIRNGDYNLALGSGWRLNLPYVTADNNNVMVRLPNGSYYSAAQMEIVNKNIIPTLYHDITFENHNGDDFTFSVKLQKTLLKDLTTSLGNKDLSGSIGGAINVFTVGSSIGNAIGSYNINGILGGVAELVDWAIIESTLTMKDGTQYKFGKLGYITEITDPSGTNKITFEYDGLTLSKIIDPNGNEILFEYNQNSFLRPYITKISAPYSETEKREWKYTYDTTTILNKIQNSMFCVLPQLTKATDAEGRVTTYETDYSENNIIISGGGSAKLNIVLTILDFFPQISAVKDVLGVYSLTLTARFGIEWPMFIKKVTTPDRGIQTVSYSLIDQSVFEVKPSDYFLGLVPTAVKFSYDFYQILAANSVTIINNGETRKTDYTLFFTSGGSQHLVYSSVVDDGNTCVCNDYTKYSKKRYKYICVDDNITDLMSTITLTSEESNWETSYYTRIKSSEILMSNKNRYEVIKYDWDDNKGRILSERRERNKLYYDTTYTYDKWGNITSQIENQGTNLINNKTVQTTKITKSKYFNTDSTDISGFPSGISNTPSQKVSGTKNLLVQQSIYDGYMTVYTGNVYDAYGRLISNSIYTDDNQWATTTYKYSNITGTNKVTDGLLTTVTDPVGQVSNYSYNVKDKKLTTTITMPLSDNNSISTATDTDLRTGWIVNEKDGRGNVTSYLYDKLGRQTKVMHPGNISETVDYDDKNHVIKIYKDGKSKPAEEYKFDDLNNLISQTQYNYFENNSSITASLEYDRYNNIISMTDQNGNKTNYSYDSIGRLLLQKNPDNTTKQFQYDEYAGTRISIDENGNEITEELTYSGLVLKKEWYVSGSYYTEQTEYDGNGRPVSIIDPLGQKTTIKYSVFGNEKERILPSVMVTQNGTASIKTPYVITKYNKQGLPVNETSGTEGYSKVVDTVFDGLGRKISVKESFGTETRTINYEYDSANNLVKEIDAEGNSKSYTYTPRNKLETETDALGYITSFEYDRDDNQTKITDAAGFSIIFDYDDYGRLVKAYTPAAPGNNTPGLVSITYDKRGNALSMVDSSGKNTTWTYDKLNRKKSEIISGSDAVAVEKSWTYDKAGNVVTETLGHATITNTYDAINRLIKKEEPDGQVENYKYDGLSRVIQIINSNGTQNYTYNSLNKVIESIDSLHNVITHSYDIFGNETKTKYEYNDSSRDQIWNRKYNAWGQLLEESNNSGQKWTYAYNGRGLLSNKTDPAGTSITPSYDANGNVIRERRTNGSKIETKSYTYDAVGFMYKANDNGVSSSINIENNKYIPNAWGLITNYETKVNGKTLDSKYLYDSALNNISIIYPDAQQVSFVYNKINQLVSIGNNGNKTLYADGGTYNSAGNFVSINAANGTKRSFNWNDSKNQLSDYNWNISGKSSVSLTWDIRGNIIQEKGNDTITYSYDELNRLVSENTNQKIEVSGKGQFKYGYAQDDVVGNRELVFNQNNIDFDYYSSSIGLDLVSQKRINGITLTGNSKRLDKDYLEIYVSNNGLDGNWEQVTDIGFKKYYNKLEIIFKKPVLTSYIKIHSTWDERDINYQPVNKAEISGNMADIVEVFYLADGKTNTWAYDAKGNRINEGTTIEGSTSSISIEYYNNTDLLKKYGEWYFNYDANGNLIQRGNKASWNNETSSYDYSDNTGEIWIYEYDLSNRMTKVLYSDSGSKNISEKASYLYDYRGLCVAKSCADGIEYREYLSDGRLLYVTNEEATIDYVYCRNTIFVELRSEDSETKTYYHHTNHLGTTQVITDSNANIVWEASYEAFGARLSENGTKYFTACYTGKFFDKDIGMYYFNARWYDAETGRFVTQDPAQDGINWYCYCNGNPVGFVDPDGLTTIDDYYYKKVTGTKTQKGKNNYIQQQTQSWESNQGYSEYTNGTPNQRLIDPGHSAMEQYEFLKQYYDNYKDAKGKVKGLAAKNLRDQIRNKNRFDLKGLFSIDESFMNNELRDFLNLNENGNMYYTLKELRNESAGWKELSSWGSMYHQTNAGDSDYLNAKFVNIDGREVVITRDGIIITSGIDKGTFNYGPPSIAPGSVHKLYDMNPFERQYKGEYVLTWDYHFMSFYYGNSKYW